MLAVVASAIVPAIAGCTQSGPDGPETEPDRSTGTELGGERATGDGTRTERANGDDVAVLVAGPDGERTFFDGDDIENVGMLQQQRDGDGYKLPVQLSSEGAAAATEAFRAVGGDDAPEETTVTVSLDGEEKSFGVTSSLAEQIGSGDWLGEFTLPFEEAERAETVKDSLRAASRSD